MNNEIIHKEIDLIQSVVSRMAENSFKVKGWLITLLMAIIAFTKDEILVNSSGDIGIILTISLYLPTLGFWYLDAFFLKTEKLYRNLYKWVVKYRKDSNDYLYDLNSFERTINGKKTNIEIPNLAEVMFSKTLLVFYILPLILITGILMMKILK